MISVCCFVLAGLPLEFCSKIMQNLSILDSQAFHPTPLLEASTTTAKRLKTSRPPIHRPMAYQQADSPQQTNTKRTIRPSEDSQPSLPRPNLSLLFMQGLHVAQFLQKSLALPLQEDGVFARFLEWSKTKRDPNKKMFSGSKSGYKYINKLI